MNWTGLFFVGYAVLVLGVLAALGKWGVLTRIGTGWTLILCVLALGIGIMLAVTRRHSGEGAGHG